MNPTPHRELGQVDEDPRDKALRELRISHVALVGMFHRLQQEHANLVARVIARDHNRDLEHRTRARSLWAFAAMVTVFLGTMVIDHYLGAP